MACSYQQSVFLEKLEMVRAHNESRQLHIGPFLNPGIAGYGDASNGRGALTIRTLLQMDVTYDAKLC